MLVLQCSGNKQCDLALSEATMLAAGLDNGATKVIGIDKEARYLKMAAKRVGEG